MFKVISRFPFHLKLMDDKQFKEGNFTTKFLDTFDFSDLK